MQTEEIRQILLRPDRRTEFLKQVTTLSVEDRSRVAYVAAILGGNELNATYEALRRYPLIREYVEGAHSRVSQLAEGLGAIPEGVVLDETELAHFSSVLNLPITDETLAEWDRAERNAWRVWTGNPTSLVDRDRLHTILVRRADNHEVAGRLNLAALYAGAIDGLSELYGADSAEQADSFSRLGRLMTLMGEPAVGLNHASSAFGIWQKLSDEAPSDLERAIRFGHARAHLIKASLDTGDIIGARAHAVKSIKWASKCAREWEADPRFSAVRAKLIRHLGLVGMHAEDAVESSENLEKARSLVDQALMDHPNRPDLLEELLWADHGLMLFSTVLSDKDKIVHRTTSALEASDRLETLRPHDASIRYTRGQFCLDSCDSCLAISAPDCALEYAEAGAKIAQALWLQDSLSVSAVRLFATTLGRASFAAKAMGSLGKAWHYVREGLTLREELITLTDSSLAARFDYALALGDVAQVARESSDVPEAIAYFTQAEARFDELYQELHGTPEWPLWEEGVLHSQLSLLSSLVELGTPADRPAYWEKLKQRTESLPAGHSLRKTMKSYLRDLGHRYKLEYEEPPSLLGRLFGRRK